MVFGRLGAIKEHTDFLRIVGLDLQTAVVGREGEAASTPVNQHGEFHRVRTAVVEKFIESGFDGAAGVHDVVDEDDGCTIHIVWDDGGRKFLGDGLPADVVAVKRNVDGAGAADEAFGAETLGETIGEDDAAIGDAEQKEAGGLMVPADNCGNDSTQGLFDRFGVVFRGGCHEPKVLRRGVRLVQRKGRNTLFAGRESLSANNRCAFPSYPCVRPE